MRSVCWFLWDFVVCAFGVKGAYIAVVKYGIAAIVLLFGVIVKTPVIIRSPGWFCWDTTLGISVAIALAVGWVGIAGGLAYARFSKSRVSLDDTMVSDTEAGRYGVRVSNRGQGIAEQVRAMVLRATSDVGSDFPARLPVEVRWEHHNPGERPELAANIHAIAWVLQPDPRRAPANIEVIQIPGSRGTIDLLENRMLQSRPSFWIQVSVYDSNGRGQEKWFRVEPVSDQFMVYRGISVKPPFISTWRETVARWLKKLVRQRSSIM